MRILSLCFILLLVACNQHKPTTQLESTTMSEPRPYGSWPSPISAASVVAGARGIAWLSKDGDDLYWVESRPAEGGRNTIMRRRAGGEPEELLPQPWNVHAPSGMTAIQSQPIQCS